MAKKRKTSSRSRTTALRKLRPTAQLPTGRVLKDFSAEQVQRLRRLISEELECVYHPSFRSNRSVESVLRECDRTDQEAGTGRRATLTAEQERELFLRFNYCRHRMMKILRQHAGKRLTAAAARELLAWEDAMLRTREAIVEANLGLVPTMVERSRVTGVDFGELISEGHMALLRAVSKFDCARGFKFSTYACRAILTAITRAVALMARHRSTFPTEFDPDLQKSDFIETRRAWIEEDCMDELRSILKQNEAELTRTEREILTERFGVRLVPRRRRNSGALEGQKTLREVAEIFGVTKERIRQIQNKALRKLRSKIDERIVPS